MAGALRARPLGDFLAFAAGAADFCGWAFFVRILLLRGLFGRSRFWRLRRFAGLLRVRRMLGGGLLLRRFFLRLAGFLSGGFSLARADEALRTKTDQILSVRKLQRFMHEFVVLRVLVLHERALHRLFMRDLGDIDRLHRPGI